MHWNNKSQEENITYINFLVGRIRKHKIQKQGKFSHKHFASD